MENLILSNVEASKFLKEHHKIDVPAWKITAVRLYRNNAVNKTVQRFFCWKWQNENGAFRFMKFDGQLYDRWADKNVIETAVIDYEGLYTGDTYLSLNVSQNSVVLFDDSKKVDIVYRTMK